jgi:hypothetical protein
MTAFNVEAFKAEALRDGLVKTSNFMVTFSPPRCLTNGDAQQKSRKMAFLCRSSQTPSYGIMTDDVRPYGVGSVMKMPYGAIHDSINMSFYVDAKMDAVDFFTAWIKSISPMINRTDKAFNGAYDGEVRYYDDIKAEIKIAQYTENSKIAIITLHDAFPINVGSMELSWDDPQLQVLPVTFEYRAYTIELVDEFVNFTNFTVSNPIQVPSVPPTPPFGISFNPFGRAFNSGRLPNPIESGFRVDALSSLDYTGYGTSNDLAGSFREQLSSITFGLNGLMNKILSAVPVQRLLNTISRANSIASGLTTLRSNNNNLQNTINSNLVGVRSQLRNIQNGFRFP